MKTYKVTWTTKQHSQQIDHEKIIRANNAKEAREMFDAWYKTQPTEAHPFHVTVKLDKKQTVSAKAPVYDNADRACNCIKCELVTSCPYNGKYQRLSSRDAVGALGLCPKLPDGFRSKFVKGCGQA